MRGQPRCQRGKLIPETNGHAMVKAAEGGEVREGGARGGSKKGNWGGNEVRGEVRRGGVEGGIRKR